MVVRVNVEWTCLRKQKNFMYKRRIISGILCRNVLTLLFVPDAIWHDENMSVMKRWQYSTFPQPLSASVFCISHSRCFIVFKNFEVFVYKYKVKRGSKHWKWWKDNEILNCIWVFLECQVQSHPCDVCDMSGMHICTNRKM